MTTYTLPPDLASKASHLGAFRFHFAIFGLFYQLALLLFVLHFGFGVKFRDWAEKISPKRWVQAFVFIPPMMLSLGILTLPSDIYEHSVAREYGLSIQGWASWLGDWAKGQGISVIFGLILISILFWVIRRNARRWWFYFWLASLPLIVAAIFIQPVVIDPLFHKFEPLQSKAPELAARLEKMVQRAGEDIPVERMFWMGASEKSTTLNAYVTGVGASKRIVIWDTTIAKMTTPQIVFVTGHEMGHYVLKHIWKGLIATAILFFVVFYLAFRSVDGVLRRYGARWRIRSVDDWAAFPVLILLFSAFIFLTTPLMSALSRHIEHQADQYGLEVTYGLQPDSGQVAAQAFQILGEVGLAEVNPNPVNVWLFFNHPSIADRVRFALTYNPWSKPEGPEFVR
jgi:STE24 endopeptidase